MGIGDLEFGPIPNPQSPIPNTNIIFNNLNYRNLFSLKKINFKNRKKMNNYF